MAGDGGRFVDGGEGLASGGGERGEVGKGVDAFVFGSEGVVRREE